MATLKEATIESIRRLPEECTLEDIMYEVNLVAQVLEGLEDAENIRVISTGELLELVDQWSK